jgi:predicted dehydrogenase
MRGRSLPITGRRIGVGGGRIVGEGCHFIDLLRFLAGSPIVAHSRLAMDSATAIP